MHHIEGVKYDKKYKSLVVLVHPVLPLAQQHFSGWFTTVHFSSFGFNKVICLVEIIQILMTSQVSMVMCCYL